MGVSPPGHLLVTNQELYCMADEIASRLPFDWRGVRLFFDGRRFAYALSTDDVFVDVGGREAFYELVGVPPGQEVAVIRFNLVKVV